MQPDLLVGVDFSGDVGRWRASSRRPSVWIATGHTNEKGLHCTGLCAVQQLPGTEHPFNRLSRFLATAFSSYAAIDAPFSVPFSIAKDAEIVWRRVLDLATNGRPFAKGQALIEAFAPQLAPRGAKIMRLTEKYWQDKGVNVRSTMWAGPRGGAPFAVACMTLLAGYDGPIWPLRLSPRGCMLIEGFPAGQLRQWGQHHFGYNGPAGGAVARRTSLVDWMQGERGLRLSAHNRCMCISSADALDAVICMYAAAAVRNGRLAMTAPEYAVSEGLIAVHA
jgi:hypothetical protein